MLWTRDTWRLVTRGGPCAEVKDVNYINAHATSTPAGDMDELRVLQNKFGGNPGVKINSTKSMIGHLLGAASAVEAVACIKGMGRFHSYATITRAHAHTRTRAHAHNFLQP